MPEIQDAEFIKWDGNRCYVKVSCTDLTPQEHYVIYPMFGGRSKASWGFRPRETSHTVAGYIVGDKIDFGDCDIQLRLCVDGDPEVYVAIKTLYIPPKTKPTCAQEFYVTNQLSGNPVKGALCHITTGLFCITEANGKCNITLNSDDEYTVKFSHDNYEPQSKRFAACKETVVISLNPKPCSQKIQVKDNKGNVLKQAKVIVDGTTKYTSMFGAPCSFELTSGVEYEAVASYSNYECHDCKKSFTACTGTITLTLKKPTPTTANITFDSSPKGATVRVDGTLIGNT